MGNIKGGPCKGEKEGLYMCVPTLECIYLFFHFYVLSYEATTESILVNDIFIGISFFYLRLIKYM